MVADCLLRINLWFDAWKGGEGAFPIFGAAAANAGKGLDDDCLIAPHRPRLQAARPSVRRGAQALLLISRNCCVMEKLWTTPSRPAAAAALFKYILTHLLCTRRGRELEPFLGPNSE